MAEFIFKKDHYVNADSEKDRIGVHKKGDFINIKPDGWSDHPNWHQSKYPVRFVVVKCPEITVAEAINSGFRDAWKDNFDYEIISSNPAQGKYTVRVFNTTISNSGLNKLSLEKVEKFLLDWGCKNISFSDGSVTFTLSLWNAVRSNGFWSVRLIMTKVIFNLDSYNSQSGIGQITAEIIDQNMDENSVITAIESRGGVVVTNNYPFITFQIERSKVLGRFREEIKIRAERVYKRHRFCISESEVDQIANNGGIITISRSMFLNSLIDHLGI